MNKKGENAVPPVVIGVIALIVAFVVIAFVVTQRIYGDTEEIFTDEICHNSVVFRATAPEIVQSQLPLQCSANKICITGERGERCSSEFAGEDVRIVRVDTKNAEETKNKIEEEYANAMFSCWKTMGEGKLDIFGKGVTDFSVSESRCVVCSRIAFGEDLFSEENKRNILDRVDVNEYMRTNQVPRSSFTYLQLLTDERVNSYSGIDSAEPGEFDARQIGIIFGQVKTKEKSIADAIIDGSLTGGFVFGGASVLTPVGKAVKFVSLPVTVGAFLTSVLGTGIVAGIQTARGQAIAAGFCGEFSSAADTKFGCSVVRGIEFDGNAINNFCKGGIEGEL